MNILNKLSELTSIDSKYWILIIKTLIFFYVVSFTFGGIAFMLLFFIV